jgi:hypothetical protein
MSILSEQSAPDGRLYVRSFLVATVMARVSVIGQCEIEDRDPGAGPIMTRLPVIPETGGLGDTC